MITRFISVRLVPHWRLRAVSIRIRSPITHLTATTPPVSRLERRRGRGNEIVSLRHMWAHLILQGSACGTAQLFSFVSYWPTKVIRRYLWG